VELVAKWQPLQPQNSFQTSDDILLLCLRIWRRCVRLQLDLLLRDMICVWDVEMEFLSYCYFASFVFLGLLFLYFPPKHSNGLSYAQVLRGMGYGGKF
jgi:hypothetical protein